MTIERDAKVYPFDKTKPNQRSSTGATPPEPDLPRDSEGLAEGYWREDGAIWMMAGPKRKRYSLRLCSDMKAVHGASAPDGNGWAVTVEAVDPRGVRKQVVLPRADAETDAAKCIRTLTDAGLVIHTDDTKRHRLILNAVVRARSPLAYNVAKTGRMELDGRPAFALPPPVGVIEPDRKPAGGSIVVWRGGTQFNRMRQGGTRDGWIAGVAGPAEKVPLAAAAIGAMLSGPGIPYLPLECELNTMIHVVGESGEGKTTMVRAAASVYGKGAPTTDPESFIESYKNTANSVENVLLAHNHVGACFDELKTVDQKAAATLAYDFAAGRRKGRMNSDGSSRPTHGWALPILSSGELTLADRANEHPGRRQTMDSGAEVRVLNIASAGAFASVGNQAEQKAFAEALGAASATNYGFAGPEFIRFLINDEDGARRAIEKNLAIWKAVSAPLLGAAPSSQATRVASRLGSLVAPAALAAEVLALPWGGSLEGFGLSAAPAASGMFLAYAHVLGTWIGSNGLAYSTQTTEIFRHLRALYHGAPPGAFTLCGATRHDIMPDIPASATVSTRGWKAISNITVKTDKFGATTFAEGVLEYVDFSLDVLRQFLGQTGRALTQALGSLRASKLLIVEKQDGLMTQRKVDGRNVRVYRIKVEFFADVVAGTEEPDFRKRCHTVNRMCVEFSCRLYLSEAANLRTMEFIQYCHDVASILRTANEL